LAIDAAHDLCSEKKVPVNDLEAMKDEAKIDDQAEMENAVRPAVRP
jgi:hypothetical protein